MSYTQGEWFCLSHFWLTEPEDCRACLQGETIVPPLIQPNNWHINKRKAPLIQATSWVDLKGIMLNERIAYSMICITFWKWHKNGDGEQTAGSGACVGRGGTDTKHEASQWWWWHSPVSWLWELDTQIYTWCETASNYVHTHTQMNGGLKSGETE